MTTAPGAGPADEPTRLREIVARVFAGQAGWTETLGGPGSAVTLTAGADAQDDCAVLHMDGPLDIVVGSDYVRGARFYLFEEGLLDEYDVGWYLTAANFSDVAAMGAAPVALLSVVRYPKDMPDETFKRVLEGIRDGCHAVGALNVGGDIGGAERLILSATALGALPSGKALLRSGATEGEIVCVTGPTGTAGAALAYFRSVTGRGTLPEEDEAALLRPWRRAAARCAAGRVLAESGVVTACIDTSDGLKGALEGIAQSSAVGIRIRRSALPVPPVVTRVAAVTGDDEVALVFGDSVDFELLFTLPAPDEARLRAAFADASMSFHTIGRVVEQAEGLTLEQGGGQLVELPGTAWRHVEPVTGA